MQSCGAFAASVDPDGQIRYVALACMREFVSRFPTHATQLVTHHYQNMHTAGRAPHAASILCMNNQNVPNSFILLPQVARRMLQLVTHPFSMMLPPLHAVGGAQHAAAGLM